MASKLCLLAFLVVALTSSLMLVADATIIRTTVSEIEEENPAGFRGGGSCSQEKLREMSLMPCMRWMMQDSRYVAAAMNPRISSQYKEECCNMMGEMPDRCRCDALKNMLNKQCESRSMSQETRKMCQPEMMQKMMDIPHMCSSEMRSCQYGMILV